MIHSATPASETASAVFPMVGICASPTANLSTPAVTALPQRILIVDDNTDAAESTAVLLGLDGHKVEVAADGPTALRCAPEFRPDVVLLDIGLPDMDGYEVARRLRATPDCADTMLIAHSGYAGEEHFERARQAGFDHHLVKPVSIAQLNEVISAFHDLRSWPEGIP